MRFPSCPGQGLECLRSECELFVGALDEQKIGGLVEADRRGSALGDAELAHIHAEVGPGGLSDPVGAVPEVDLIEVEVEDLVFGELTL